MMGFMQVEHDKWTGEGTFTPVLLEALKGIDAIEFLRVEDAPASRAEPGYAFISNEIYVKFRTDLRRERRCRFGIPWQAAVQVKQMTLGGLAGRLGQAAGVGDPDYADDAMLQYLRTERIVAPYQTKGCKVVEMVRIYEVGTPRREA
jgi:hypothetical protein